MTIKELREHFDYVVKSDNQYHVHIEGGKRCAYKYLATVNKKGKSMFVTGYKPTTKIDVLKQQINDFVASLPYDSEYYSPLYRKGYREEIIIHDYLESIHFKRNGVDDYYILETPSIYGYQSTKVSLFFKGLDAFNGIKENVDVCLSTGDYSYVVCTCKRNVQDIIKTIDSLLKPLLLTESTSNIKLADKMKNNSTIDIVLKELQGLDIKETNIKQYLKNELLKIANEL